MKIRLLSVIFGLLACGGPRTSEQQPQTIFLTCNECIADAVCRDLCQQKCKGSDLKSYIEVPADCAGKDGGQ